GVAVLSVAAPLVTSTGLRLHEVGLRLGFATQFVLWSLVIVLAGTTALIVGSVASAYAAKLEIPLRYAARVVSVITVVLLWPVLHFFATDWKWTAGVKPANVEARDPPNVVLI